MKLGIAASWVLAASTVSAFTSTRVVRPRFSSSTTQRSFGVDPSVFSDLPQHMDTMRDTFTTLTLSDAMEAASSVASPEVMDATAAAATDASGNGWFGFLTIPIEGLLYTIHSALSMVGMSENSWGISIVMLTVLIKVLTFPLTKTQLESTNKMQALQPTIKELQAKYQSNPEVMNQKIAEIYQTNDVNPLAGCLPSLAQIPVFIGLYRAVLGLAKENALDESFLWLPNLEGPTYGADPAHGSDWLFANWVDGAPSLGWDNTIAFLILPVCLVISQFASMQLMQPKTDDPQQQQANVILKFLPLMIGWFSLNVPAALCIYWFVNNIVTTATTLYIRSTVKSEPIMPSSTGGAATMEPPSSIFAPPPIRDRPEGFSSTINTFEDDSSGVKPITAIDAEIVSDGGETASDGEGMSTPAPKKKSRGKKKKKRRN